jgi:hypothetical protein
VAEIEAAAGSGGTASPDLRRPRFAHIDQSWGRTGRRPQPMVAVSEGPYRLVYRAAARSSELFDHAADPREQHDAGVEHPEILARLTALAQDYLELPAAPWGAAPEVELSEDQIQQLRALGYGVE